jgi:hypothetical protein
MTGELMSKSNATFFFVHQGIMHYEFDPEGQIIKIFIW